MQPPHVSGAGLAGGLSSRARDAGRYNEQRRTEVNAAADTVSAFKGYDAAELEKLLKLATSGVATWADYRLLAELQVCPGIISCCSCCCSSSTCAFCLYIHLPLPLLIGEEGESRAGKENGQWAFRV